MPDTFASRATDCAWPCSGSSGWEHAPHQVMAPTSEVTALALWHTRGVITLFCTIAAAQLVAVNIDLLTVPTLASLLILGLGVPHGAADIAIIERQWHLTTWRQTVGALVVYVALAGCVIFAWWLRPQLCLALFLSGSAYHFGGDWGHNPLARTLRGAALLTATAVYHVQQDAEIFGWLTSPSTGAAMAVVMQMLSIPLLILAAIHSAMLACERSLVALEYGVVLSAALVLSPITFFVLYFCLLHSPRHMMSIRKVMWDWTLPRIVAKSAPYAGVAIGATLLGATLMTSLNAGPQLLTSVFIALAALTVPHMLMAEQGRDG